MCGVWEINVKSILFWTKLNLAFNRYANLFIFYEINKKVDWAGPEKAASSRYRRYL